MEQEAIPHGPEVAAKYFAFCNKRTHYKMNCSKFTLTSALAPTLAPCTHTHSCTPSSVPWQRSDGVAEQGMLTDVGPLK